MGTIISAPNIILAIGRLFTVDIISPVSDNFLLSIYFFLWFSLMLYIYIFIYVCM